MRCGGKVGSVLLPRAQLAFSFKGLAEKIKNKKSRRREVRRKRDTSERKSKGRGGASVRPVRGRGHPSTKNEYNLFYRKLDDPNIFLFDNFFEKSGIF